MTYWLSLVDLKSANSSEERLSTTVVFIIIANKKSPNLTERYAKVLQIC